MKIYLEIKLVGKIGMHAHADWEEITRKKRKGIYEGMTLYKPNMTQQ